MRVIVKPNLSLFRPLKQRSFSSVASSGALRTLSPSDSSEANDSMIIPEKDPTRRQTKVVLCGNTTEYRTDHDDTQYMKRLKVSEALSEKNYLDIFGGWDLGVKIQHSSSQGSLPSSVQSLQSLNPFW